MKKNKFRKWIVFYKIVIVHHFFFMNKYSRNCIRKLKRNRVFHLFLRAADGGLEVGETTSLLAGEGFGVGERTAGGLGAAAGVSVRYRIQTV